MTKVVTELGDLKRHCNKLLSCSGALTEAIDSVIQSNNKTQKLVGDLEKYGVIV